MPTPTYDEIDAHVRDKYIPVLIDQVYFTFPLFVRLTSKSRVVYDSGDKIDQPVLYGDLPGGSYSGLDTFDVSTRQTTTLAKWDWKFYYTDVTIDGPTMLKTKGTEKVLNIVESKMENASKTMKKLLTQDIFGDGTGNNSKAMDGLLNAIATTGTYGEINKANFDWWQGNYDSTGGAFSLNMVQTQCGNATDGNIKPDMIITTQTIWNKFWARVQPAQRYISSKRNADLAQIGFSGIEFNDAVVIVDKYCPSGYIFILNTDFWKLVVHRDRDMDWTPPKTPLDQDAYVRQVLWAGNLVCQAPRWEAMISSVT